MAVVRTETPEYGGLNVFDDTDATPPVYLVGGVLDAVLLEAAILAKTERQFQIDEEEK